MSQFEFDFDICTTVEPEDHNVAYGDVWVLGRHLLKCGDSCNDRDVSDLMGGELADMVFTDPPYGMGKESDGVRNDNLNNDDLLKFNKVWIPISLNHLKQNGSWYCWGKDEPLMDIYSEIVKPLKHESGERKVTFCNLITWDKGRGGLERKAVACADIRHCRKNAFSSCEEDRPTERQQPTTGRGSNLFANSSMLNARRQGLRPRNSFAWQGLLP